MLANPTLNHRCDDLHGACDIDCSPRIESRLDLISELGAEPVVRQAYNTGAMDWTVEMAREPSQKRVCHGPPTEERHWDTAHVVLIDKHDDMRAAFERFGNLHRGIKIGCDHLAHAGRTGLG